MINLKKDENGIININNLNVNMDYFSPIEGKYSFYKDNQLYFFKSCSEEEAFREVFACEFANKFNIEHASYDVASLDEHFGVMSSSVYGVNEEFIPLSVISSKLNIENGYVNTVETMKTKILPRICFYNKKEELINYIRIFVFDILLANNDRHLDNIGFIYKDHKYRFAPIFDNGLIINDKSINEHIYSQGISNDLYSTDNNYVVIEFLSSNYSKDLVEELEKLSIEDLYNLVKEINAKYPYKFNQKYEEYVLNRLNQNLNTLNDYKDKYYNPKVLLRG